MCGYDGPTESRNQLPLDVFLPAPEQAILGWWLGISVDREARLRANGVLHEGRIRRPPGREFLLWYAFDQTMPSFAAIIAPRRLFPCFGVRASKTDLKTDQNRTQATVYCEGPAEEEIRRENLEVLAGSDLASR